MVGGLWVCVWGGGESSSSLSPNTVSQLIQPINSNPVDDGPAAVTALLSGLHPPAAASSDLRQRDLQRVLVAVDVQDEGVLVGVVLDDVVVHVHQDPEWRETPIFFTSVNPRSKQPSCNTRTLTHPFLLFL